MMWNVGEIIESRSSEELQYLKGLKTTGVIFALVNPKIIVLGFMLLTLIILINRLKKA